MKKILSNKLFVVFFAPFSIGAITILGFAPYNYTFINFFTFSLLLFLISIVKKKIKSKYRKKKNDKLFFYLGCSFGFGFFLFGNYWISISLTHDEAFTGLIPFAVIIIPLFLSLFFGLAIFLTGRYAEKNIQFILIFSLTFCIFEFLRGNLLSGFPWNLISYTWSWSIEFIQILSVIGTYSLSLISITLFCIPYLFLEKKNFNQNLAFSTLFLSLLIVNYIYGFNKINDSNYKYNKNINIKIVSPNLSLKDYYTQDESYRIKRLIKISNPIKNEKTIFIWPEGIFYQSNLQDLKNYKDLFLNNFSDNHLIVLGVNNFVISKSGKEKKYYNSMVFVNNKLEILFLYNKINLVPFGEFLPLEKLFTKLGLKKITYGYNSFSSGDKRDLIKLDDNFNNLKILPLICYEIIYPGKIKLKKQNPDLVINISEDAWFGQSIGPHQHYAKAIYRSVEEGVFVARSANKGISGLIDPNGRSLKILNMNETGNIAHKIPYFFKPTIYSKYENKVFYLIILIYIFLIFILRKFKHYE